MVYSEPDLVLPALRVLKEKGGTTNTSTLIRELTRILKPKGRDREILKGRKDTYFSQKVRNLTSHGTLERKGLATYSKGKHTLTEKGEQFLRENSVVLDSLEEQGFQKEQIDREKANYYSGLIIEEGAMDKRTIRQRKRSNKLKVIALAKFKEKHNGKVFCDACGFNFQEKYGERGRGFIEIHHAIPIHEIEIKGNKTKIEEALKKVFPLCSNCHRMVHRKKNEMLSIEELKKIIQENSA